MVAIFLILIQAAVAEQVEFQTKCAKPEIFRGENVVCEFVLLGSESPLEIEVAKFPEFRGYWSENLTLRQGFISLFPFSNRLDRLRGSVGSYLLTPMAGIERPTIEPMKIVIRPRAGIETSETILASRPPTLKIKPLPVPPATHKDYRGGVGDFTISTESPQRDFQKNEPLTIRYLLSGDGNFPEINRLDLKLPGFVEVLSQHSSQHGAAMNYTKIFEMTLVTHASEDFSLSDNFFIFFSPAKKKFQKLAIPDIKFRFIPSATIAPKEAELDTPVTLEKPWATYRPILKQAAFWIAQGVIALFFLGFYLLRSSIDYKTRTQDAKRIQSAVKTELVTQAFKMGNFDTSLRLADEIAFEKLTQILDLPKNATRNQAIMKGAAKGIDPAFLRAARILFVAHAAHAYSKERTIPAKKPELEEAFRVVVGNRK